MKRGGIFIVLIAAASLAGAAETNINWSSGKHKIEIDTDHLRHDDVRVAKGETISGDVVTSGKVLVDGTVSGDCVSLGGPIEIRGSVQGDVVAAGGNASVAGKISGDLVSLGGNIRLDGSVNGEIASLGGDVNLSSRASVGGDVALLGGRLIKQPGASIRGNVTTLNWTAFRGLTTMLKHVATEGSEGEAEAPVVKTLSAWARAAEFVAFLASRLAVGIILVLMAIFLPRQIQGAASAIRGDFWISAGIGALHLILLVPAIIILAISILGIPLIPVGLFLLGAAALGGLAAFCLILTERACAALQKEMPATPSAVAVGYLVLLALPLTGRLLKFAGAGLAGGVLTFTGFFLALTGMIVGLGAIWNSRLGRREFPR